MIFGMGLGTFLALCCFGGLALDLANEARRERTQDSRFENLAKRICEIATVASLPVLVALLYLADSYFLSDFWWVLRCLLFPVELWVALLAWIVVIGAFWDFVMVPFQAVRWSKGQQDGPILGNAGQAVLLLLLVVLLWRYC